METKKLQFFNIIGQKYCEKQKWEKAIVCLDKALSINPKSDILWNEKSTSSIIL